MNEAIRESIAVVVLAAEQERSSIIVDFTELVLAADSGNNNSGCITTKEGDNQEVTRPSIVVVRGAFGRPLSTLFENLAAATTAPAPQSEERENAAATVVPLAKKVIWK